MKLEVSLVLNLILSWIPIATGTNWAVLVAGSSGWFNYRHQADVCHAYQLLRSNGFPESNIVTLMYDDIAYNPLNKFPGKIFHSLDVSSPDLYSNVVIDYKGESVNAKTFLSVLRGDAAAVAGIGSGKVLNSTENDNVFIYYTDHGAFGSIGMPSGPFLFADELNSTFNVMSQRRMFKNLVFYLDSCNSGSIFDQFLRNDGKIFAFTASRPNQVSLAIRYSAKLGTYLADEFSANWIQDTESHVASVGYTLSQQVQKVINSTIQSKAQKYGDQSLLEKSVLEFQGYTSDEVLVNHYGLRNREFSRSLEANGSSLATDGISTRDVTIGILKMQLDQESDPARVESVRREYEKQIQKRQLYDRIFARITEHLIGSADKIQHPKPEKGPEDYECLKHQVQYFTEHCMDLDEYGMTYIETLAALCDIARVPNSKIAPAIRLACERETQ